MKTVLAALMLLPAWSHCAEPAARDAGDGPLLFTEQILPLDEKGVVVSPNVKRQATDVLSKGEDILEENGSDWEKAARLHFYVDSAETRAAVEPLIRERADGVPVTWVVSPLAHPRALVGMDLVAQTDRKGAESPGSAVLPGGVRYFVSGQAAREYEDLAAATKATMAQLQKTLEEYGRSLDDVVQIKSFLHPMSDADLARKAIASLFPEAAAPPLVFVEWESSLPIEIELVAGGGESEDAPEAIEFLTPEGMKASPVYSRVTRVNSGNLIFVSGLSGREGQTAEEQVHHVFGNLKRLLEGEGSDLLHLVKATYYVADDVASQALNALRPDYYDPDRPPAASKAMVAGTGVAGSPIAVDMIAVRPAAR